MIIKVDKEGDFTTFKSMINQLDKDTIVNGIMVYFCEENEYEFKELDSILKNCTTPLFGGIFPSILSNGSKYNKGFILVGFETAVHTQILHDIHTSIDDYQEELEEFSDIMIEGQTFIINLDGLSAGVEALKEELFFTLGLSKNYIGGGAGSLSFERFPCVITDEGLLQDAAVIALLDVKSGIGVSHGWKNISEPMKATEVEGNNIISLNWEPAYQVYQQQIQALSDENINESNFFDIAKAYPFGISKMGTEMIVRDPISVIDNTTIVCVGAIPKNSFVYLLNGTPESLITGALQAKSLAKEAFTLLYKKEVPEEKVVLVIDCISRALFLEDRFQEELDVIGSHNVIGALTLGEIANTGDSYLELYNKTSVIGILED